MRKKRGKNDPLHSFFVEASSYRHPYNIHQTCYEEDRSRNCHPPTSMRKPLKISNRKTRFENELGRGVVDKGKKEDAGSHFHSHCLFAEKKPYSNLDALQKLGDSQGCCNELNAVNRSWRTVISFLATISLRAQVFIFSLNYSGYRWFDKIVTLAQCRSGMTMWYDNHAEGSQKGAGDHDDDRIMV